MSSTNVDFNKVLAPDLPEETARSQFIPAVSWLAERSAARLKHHMQSLLISAFRPYISAEFMGANGLYKLISNTLLWKDAEPRFARGKLHPFFMRFHMAQPAERKAFFLRRWDALACQIFMRDIIHQGDTIVDIGAGRGMFTIYASYLAGPTGKVIGFEPHDLARARLERDLTGNRIRNVWLIGKGASAENESKTLQIPRHDMEEASFGSPAARDCRPQPAELEPADTRLVNETPTLIKIATEGYETQAIRGLAKTIAKHHPVLITDISESRLPACGSSSGELVSLMFGLGYLGFKIELSETNETATWSVRPISPKDREIKCVWVHAESPADARDKVFARMVEG